MRRIVPKEEEEKKRKRNNIFVGIVVIIVMIGSVFGVVIGYGVSPGSGNNGQQVEYNGQTFFVQQGFWATQYQGLNMSFRTSPEREIDVNIEEQLNPMTSYQGMPLYLYSEDSIAQGEVERNLGQIATYTQQICLEEDCEENLPLRDCSQNTVIIQESSEKKINQTQNCVYIQGPTEDLSMLADEFIYRISGIK